jgi:hypothetical protein
MGPVQSQAKRQLAMTTEAEGIINRVIVEDVEYIPGFKRNLLSYVNLKKREYDMRMKPKSDI